MVWSVTVIFSTSDWDAYSVYVASFKSLEWKNETRQNETENMSYQEREINFLAAQW